MNRTKSEHGLFIARKMDTKEKSYGMDYYELLDPNDKWICVVLGEVETSRLLGVLNNLYNTGVYNG